MSRRDHGPKDLAPSGEQVSASPSQQKNDTIKIGLPRFNKKQWYALFIGLIFAGSSAAYVSFYAPPASSGSNLPEHVSRTEGTLNDPRVGPLGGIHEHFTVSVVLEGVQIDFSRPKYQLRDRRFHFEGGDGSTGHMHATGITLDYAFRTLGMQLSSACFVLDDGRSFCTNEEKTLEMFVNGRPSTAFENYAPKDGDSIVITYG